MSQLKQAIRQRIGWESCLRPFLYKELPSNLGWSATLGSLCALLFVVMAVSGMFLAMYYNPSPDKAYSSIDFIMKEVPLGPVLRGIHHWGAGAMVLAVFVHLATVFFSGSFKAPRELTWILGVCLFLVTLGLGFTGYLLPWDQKAYWATVVSANIPREIPVVGDLLSRLLLGGEGVSGLTLTRFYSIHMLVLPALMGLLILAHVYLVRLHGVSEPPAAETPSGEAAPKREMRVYRFFPEQLAHSAFVFLLVFCVILLLSLYADVPREQVAGTVDETYLPRPEWYYMWLFQLLTYFSGSTEVIGSLLVPAAMVLLLFALPFLERSGFRGAALRPLATATGVGCLIGVVYLTLTGFGDARPYGRFVMVPDRPLAKTEEMGLQVYVRQDCAYCHHILGKGGRRVGPDLSNMKSKGRTAADLKAAIKDPLSRSRWSIMPKYDLGEEAISALADFVRGLDFSDIQGRRVPREEVLGKRI
jgi:quinol-cytochrome oxidoreductase complex cytochrome b subunit